MGVAREIGENLAWAAEGRLGVDDPINLAKRPDACDEGAAFGKRRQFAEEAQRAFIEGGL
jgi:hypothetical protein